MSRILSIYNDWAFWENVLPSASNTEYSFLLDAERFRLEENYEIHLECIHDEWFFNINAMSIQIDYIAPGAGMENSRLPERGRFGIKTPCGRQMTMLVEETDHPLCVYRKFFLIPGTKITIGMENKNHIQYRYPSDPSYNSLVSRMHCSISSDGREAVLEDFSLNGTFINNQRAERTTVLRYGDHIRIFDLSIIYLGRMLAVSQPEGCQVHLKEVGNAELFRLGMPGMKDGSSDKKMFYRAPRSIPGISIEKITIDPPPNPKELPDTPLFMQIGPALTMTIPMLLGSGMMVVAARAGGSVGNSFMYTGMITAGASAVIGTFWAVINMNFSKKRIIQEEKKRFEKYGQYLIEKQNLIARLYRENSEALRLKYAPPEQIAAYDSSNEKLWNRNFRHRDVLAYRIGTGDIPFPVSIEVPQDKFTMLEDSMADKPREIKERYRIMHNVPACVDLKEHPLIGVIGDVNSWAQIIKNLVIQIAGNNSYTDVKIALLYDSSRLANPKAWDFIRWLPHVWSEDKKVRYFATDKNEAREVFYALSQSLRIRLEGGQKRIRPYYILFILNKELLEGEMIAKYMGEDSSSIGLSTIIAAEHYEALPNDCEFIIENNQEFSGFYHTAEDQAERIQVSFDKTVDDQLMVFAKRLADIEVNETESGGEIPGSVTFFEMYGISKPEELNVEDRWRRARTSETMKALIGLKNGGAPCYLDIHERYHGPHGLVAGTTGSGKSETLQTYILSLAINYSPDDVGFFIIDYKGGGMANLFQGLPHMIGAISNLSGNQVKRAMVSIKSENKRRQRIFSDYGVNNINSYTSLYKNGDAREPIPHMFIIIDEFAELKREEPDFMKELVSVAQVGRSLGVHLILATQKPAGTVDDNIWSNSKFRLCLRVQDRQDSMDMLHRADAAYLTQAGRGFLQVGNDELFELFQSGYSGAVYDEELGGRNLTVAQMINSAGKVDLAGNHFKIQFQEMVKKNWMKQVIAAADAARKRTLNQKLTDKGDDSGQINIMYEYFEQHNIEYKRSPYNDVRLKEFLSLHQDTDGMEDEERAEEIIRRAAARGIRLPERKAKSQLEAVNEYLAGEAVKHGYTHRIQLWMPLLPVEMPLLDMKEYKPFLIAGRAKTEAAEWTLSAIVGKGDDPENQNQMPIYVDFANNGHHVICGTVSTGKSTFLQTTVFSFISKYSSDEINLYLLDFSSKLLTVFEGAKQVGGIMTDGEEDGEKIAKFFTMITRMVEERKQILASANFRDYVEHSRGNLPAVIIVIDNYGGFREKTAERFEDNIKQLAKEGLAYGIYLIVSAGGFSMSDMPSRLADNFRTTICLEMQDIYAYSDIMRTVRVPVYPESNVKGRGLVCYEERIIEFQTALACAGIGKSVFERNDEIRNMIVKINSLDTGKGAKRIPVIPQKPVWDDYTMDQEYAQLLQNPKLLPNGYDGETAAYSAINYGSVLTYGVSGTKRSGKSNYIKNLILASRDKGNKNYIVELGNDEFEAFAKYSGTAYISSGEEFYQFASDVLMKEIRVRAVKKKECLEKHLEDDEFFTVMDQFQKLNIFILDMKGFIAQLYDEESKAYQAKAVVETLTSDKGFHYNVYFFAEIHDEEVPELLGYKSFRNFKDNGAGIRFGGRYLSQKLFDFENVPYRNKDAAVKAGIGTVPASDKDIRLEQIVVPLNRS